MQLSRKRTIVPDHLSSSGSNHQPQRRCIRKANESSDRKFLEERLHLLQHTYPYCSPSEEISVENNSTTTPLLWHQPRLQLPPSRRAEKSWSMSQFLDCCPMSPSPCSPFISHVSNPPLHGSNAYSHASDACSGASHFMTDDAMFITAKSSCFEETDNKRPTSYDEIQEEDEDEDEIREEATFGPLEFNYSQSNLQMTPNRLQTPYGQHYHVQNGRAGRFSNQGIAQRTVPGRPISHQHDVYEAGRPSDARTISRQLVGRWNQRLLEEYDHDDYENSMRDRPCQYSRSTLARSQGGQIEAQIKELKEVRNMKLLNRLRKQEQAIEDWKLRQILKAKEKMRQTEMKLELERRTALEKARKDIKKAQKRAEKRKHQEQKETAQKISHSYKAVEKISCVGKLLWKLACF